MTKKLNFGLFNKNFSFIKALNSMSLIFQCKDKVVMNSFPGDFTFDESTFKDGEQYYIAPFVIMDGESMPTRIRTWKGSKNHYLAEVKGNKVQAKKLESDSPLGITSCSSLEP